MNRRKFVRLVGGGTATAALAACMAEPPPAATSAWNGPAAASETRLWALAHAILAPNSHNRQPWLVDLREPDAISLRVDRERLLPETDPWFRQIMVSQGTFLELLVLALKARGIDPVVELFPQGEFDARALDDRPVATLRWTPGGVAPERDPLFAQVLRRHTAKVAYDLGRPVSPEVLAQLAAVRAAGAPSYVTAGGTDRAPMVATLRRLAIDAAQVEVSTPRTVMESNRLTRVGPDEIEQHRDGIALNGWMPRLAVALGLFDRSRAPAPGSSGFKQMMQRYEAHARTAGAFLWITTAAPAGGTRSAEVWAGRLFVRQQLLAAALGLQVHPLSQAAQEFVEMKPHYDALHRLLAGGTDSGRVVQMLCRVGYCAPQPHTPRRPLESVLRA